MFRIFTRKVTLAILLLGACGFCSWRMLAQQSGGLTQPPKPVATKPEKNPVAAVAADGVPFQPGERLAYNVTWSRFPTAARLETEVLERGAFFGQEGYQLRAKVETTGEVKTIFFELYNQYTTYASAKSIIEAFNAADMNILVQEYIKEAGGTDIRALVVGGVVVASMMRSGKSNDFRSNLHRGGKAEAVTITEEERATAIRSAEVLGLNVAGVDMLRSNRGPVVMEVNSSPGIEGMEEATGVDVAGAMIEFLETSARRGETRTRGIG